MNKERESYGRANNLLMYTMVNGLKKELCCNPGHYSHAMIQWENKTFILYMYINMVLNDKTCV